MAQSNDIDPAILQIDANARVKQRMSQAATLQGYLDAGMSGRLPGQPWSAKAMRKASREAKKMRPFTIKRIDGSTEVKIRGVTVQKTDRKGNVVFSKLSNANPADIGKVFGINMVSAFGDGKIRGGGIQNPVQGNNGGQQGNQQGNNGGQQGNQQGNNGGQQVAANGAAPAANAPQANPQQSGSSQPQRSTAEIAQSMKKSGAYWDNGTWRTKTGQAIGNYDKAAAYLDTSKTLKGTGAYYDHGVWRTKTGSKINDAEQYASVSAATKGTGAYYDAGVWRTNTGARLDLQSLDLTKGKNGGQQVAANGAAPAANAPQANPATQVAKADTASATPTATQAATPQSDSQQTQVASADTGSDATPTKTDEEEAKADMKGGRTMEVFRRWR